MNRLLATLPRASQQALRQISTSNIQRAELVKPDLTKLKQNQKHFQIDDGTPVHLKGGSFDRLLYASTMGLCVFGLGYFGYVIYGMAMPPKN